MKIISHCRGIWTRLTGYIKSHIWVSLISATLTLFLLVVLIFQNYLKNEYFDYLVAETWKTEETVLASSSAHLDSLLQNVLYVSSELAVNETLQQLAERVMYSEAHNRARSRLTLETELEGLCRSSGNVTALAVITEDGQICEYGRLWAGGAIPKFWIGDNSILLNSMYESIQSMLEEDVWPRYLASTVPAAHSYQPDKRLFHIALPLKGRDSNFDNIHSALVVSFQLSELAQDSALVSSDLPSYTCGYLTDSEGVIIYHENGDYIGTLAEDHFSDETLDLQEALGYFGWTAHISIDTRDIRSEVEQMYRQGLVVYILLLIFCCLLWQLMLRHILAPMNSIREAMEDVRQGKTNRKIPIGGTHELWQLAEQYNAMIDALLRQQQRVQQYYDEKVLSIEQRNQAEREALESQINAHFLCNTLNAINYNVLESGNYEVSILLKTLSNILYYTFSRKTRVVTLGQELEWVRQYLYLQKYRLMDRFEYEIRFPEEYSEWPCCKLFLQPFVENSILHGFEGIERGGLIRITGYAPEGGLLAVQVWDNGCGIAPEVSQVIQASFEEGGTLKLAGNGTGIGIRNVVTRMRMYFGQSFRVRLETTPGAGTCFTFWLPIPENPEEHPMEDDAEEAERDENFDC